MTDEDTPRHIRRLDASVVNRIAAGEIIIQPANALKEMLENSIDAGATHIDVLAKDGGLKLLQITDNGSGIDKSDLGLLCERFATSKITSFEDLNAITTYGFRGEALASISHIARLTVVTKTKQSPVAYKAFYANGVLTSATFKEAQNVDPKPTAGKDGTQILVEDLFYNVPSRLKTLRSKSEEFSRILDVIGRYAVHAEGVGISCKRFGESMNLLNTRVGMTLEERIRTVFGNDIANELIKVDLSDRDDLKSKCGLVRAHGVITNSNFNNKRRVQPVFFINNRLVTCDPLKRAIYSVFKFFLPKNAMPFVYLSLELVPQNLDVNIHPTKREVRFLHEEEVIEAISELIHASLSNIDKSRKFKAQSIITNSPRPQLVLEPALAKKTRQESKLVRVDTLQSRLRSFLRKVDGESFKKLIANEFSLSELKPEKSPDAHEENEKETLILSKLDREEGEYDLGMEGNSDDAEEAESEVSDENIDSKEEPETEESDVHQQERIEEIEGLNSGSGANDTNTVNSELPTSSTEPITETNGSVEGQLNTATTEFEEDDEPVLKRRRLLDADPNIVLTERKRYRVNLDSIKTLREQINEKSNRPLTEVFSDLTFVGIVDEEKRLCCFQHDVKLFLCDYASILREFYYQVALSEFYNYGEYVLSQPVVLDELLDILRQSSEKELVPNKEIIESIMNMKQMFQEYFRIDFGEDSEGRATIRSLPMILKEIKPSMTKLPYFIYRLGTRVDYSEEQACLDGILQQIALLYIPEPIAIVKDPKTEAEHEEAAINKVQRDKTENLLEHVLFPKLKQRFVATSGINKDVIQIADLPGLYRVFERC